MANELTQEPTIPGIGAAGFVICPFMSLTHPAQCMRQGCELWVELKYGDTMVARCTLAWMTILATETREAIDKLSKKKPKGG